MNLLLTFLLAASVVFNMWLIGRAANPRKKSSHSTLIQSIKNVKELLTLRQYFQSVLIFKDSKELCGFSLPGTERRFILKYGGVIICGNDLENIQISERLGSDNVRIVVPRSKLLDIYADMKSIQVYDQRAGLFTSIKLSDQNRELANNIEEVWQEALRNNILRRADENAREFLKSFAGMLGMDAEVVFDDQDSEAITLTTADRALFVISEPKSKMEEDDSQTANSESA